MNDRRRRADDEARIMKKQLFVTVSLIGLLTCVCDVQHHRTQINHLMYQCSVYTRVPLASDVAKVYSPTGLFLVLKPK